MDATTHICQCGCAQPIPPRNNHRFKAPRYLLGHASRDPRVRAQMTATYRSRQVRPPDTPVYRCHCGCDEEIPWRPTHKRWRPRYIQNHYLRDDTTLRVRNSRLAKAATRLQPPMDWKTPSGLCECGCGKSTKPCKESHPERDEYTGFPHRFVHGHHMRAMWLKRGAEHNSWKGGRCVTRGGYILIYKPDYPSASKRDGYVLEHRYVYETTRNVRLTSAIIVHHINGDKTDNRPDNLIASTRSNHQKLHMKAGQIIGLFLDDRLLDAAKTHVRTHGTLPDLETLTQQLYVGAHVITRPVLVQATAADPPSPLRPA